MKPAKFFLSGLCLLLGSLQVTGQTKPNIVLILADDMGFSDLGCYGSEIHTPNLDGLAANGLRFMQFYNAGRCCPTRASLLSGVYPHQAGMGHMAGPTNLVPETFNYQGFLPDNIVTLAQVLKSAGYYTAQSGKWHVGRKNDSAPQQRGFDHSYEGQGFYFLNDAAGSHTVNIDGVATVNGGDPDPDNWYSSYKWAEWGTKYIGDAVSQEKPFFLYLAFNAPHFPLAAPDSSIQKYLGRYSNGWSELRKERYARQKAMGLIDDSYVFSPDDEDFTPWNSLTDYQKAQQDSIMATYAAVVDIMDQSIGIVIDTLKARGVFDNTLILFLADNGGNSEGPATGLGRNSETGVPIGSPLSNIFCGGIWANAQNTPFRQYKHYIHEGGIRTSFIAHWPEGIPARGEFRHQPAHLIDIMPTLAEVSGATYPETFNGNEITPMQGVSLIPAFANQSLQRDTLCWEHEANRGIRIGNMKCVAMVDPLRVFLPSDHDKWELFDIAADPTEMNNLAESRPELLQEMVTLWEEWALETGVFPWPWGSYTPYDPITGNLIFHYPFDGNLLDKSANQIQLQNTTDSENFFSTDSAGVYGNALALSGEPATFLEITRPELLDPDVSDYTVCCWVKNKSEVTHHPEHIILHQAYHGAGSTRFLLSCIGSGDNGSDILKVGTYMGGTRNVSNGEVPRNQWTHIAIVGTHANSTLKFYINGVLDKEVTTNPFEASSQGFYVGKHKQIDKEEANWQGLLDDLMLFNIALDQSQIQQVMNGNSLSGRLYKSNSSNLNVFPNPASDFIRVSGENSVSSLTIFGMDGRLILRKQHVNSVNIAPLRSGYYVLEVETNNGDLSRTKIVKL